MCTKSQNPGKIKKIWALSGRLSPNTRISGRARIYPGDLGTLSLTKYCNLNVVCPDLSHLDHHVCARPQGVLEICAIVQLKTVPTLPPLPHPLPPRSPSTDMSCDNLSLLITSSSSSSLAPSSSTLALKTSQHLILLFYPTPTTSFSSFSLGPFQSLIISPPRVLGSNLIPLLLLPFAPPAHLHMSRFDEKMD